uniref:Zinc finger, CCHC-type n=1 Tax=Tanacetum cinerariifolium TaxID=118510 RepID=A0A6L2LP15_TANCI|nr:zinc finger, CCHC-type [Tanacetum cinerariifolium]
MGNESTTLEHGRGCVDLRFSSGKVVSLLNVLHEPNIRKNLVSSSVLNNYGYKQVIESNKFVLSKHGVLIGFGYLSNHMFRLNIVSDNIGSAFMSTSKVNDSILWHARLGRVYFKRMQDMSKDGLILQIVMDTEKCKTCMLTKITKKPFQNVKRVTKVLELIHSDLCDLHATPSLGNKNYFMTFMMPLGEKGIECIFVGYAEHSKAFKLYVIEPNDLVAINCIIESKDAIFDEHRFSSVPKLSQRSLVLTDLPSSCKPLGCKWIFKRKLKVDGTVENFKASLIIHQMDVKTAFLNGELEEEVYMNQPLGFIMLGSENKDMGKADVILGIRIKRESNGIAISQSHYIEKVLKKFNYSDCTPVSTPLDTYEKLMPNRGLVVSQLEYSRVIGCLMYVLTYNRPDVAFVVGKLSRYTSNPRTQHWQVIQRVLKYLKKTIDYRLVYYGYPSVLEATGKGVEWLKNLLLEIPLWVKPMAPISICCDSVATLANAYSQMYNGKSRHLGVRHSMIRKLITNGVVSIEFMRSQQDLADHLTKGLARDFIIKSAEVMRLKSN